MTEPGIDIVDVGHLQPPFDLDEGTLAFECNTTVNISPIFIALSAAASVLTVASINVLESAKLAVQIKMARTR